MFLCDKCQILEIFHIKTQVLMTINCLNKYKVTPNL